MEWTYTGASMAMLTVAEGCCCNMARNDQGCQGHAKCMVLNVPGRPVRLLDAPVHARCSISVL